MARTSNKKSIKEAQAKRVKDKKEMQEHLDSVFVIVKPKASDEKRFEDDFDKIFRWFTSDQEYSLSETLQKQLERWSHARACFKDDAYTRNMDVANELAKTFKISTQQAYKDIANCKRLYRYAEAADYEFEKVMHIERVKKHIKFAELLGVKGLKELARLDQQLTILMGFDKEKEQSPMPIDVNIIAMDNPELVGGKRISNLEEQIHGVLQKALAEKIEKAEDTTFEDA